MSRLIQKYAAGFSELFFPRVCNGCNKNLLQHEHVFCLQCIDSFPFTDYWEMKSNPLERLFWGRVNLAHAVSLTHFVKGGPIQSGLHHLKYNGQKEVGLFLGEILGEKLKQSPFYQDIDYIIPVPVHLGKLKIRGYNQAEVIAKGIENTLHKPVLSSILIKSVATGSQTKKSREERWLNVMDGFELKCEHRVLENSSVLLVDDVLTTGATLEACAAILLKINGIRVSVATIACSFK